MPPRLRALGCAVLLLLAGTAYADDQPGDTSPDADFFGFWRVIAAQPAPWVKPHALAAGEAPFLAAMINFDDSALAGPPGLGCAPARFETRMTDPADAFDRRLDRVNYSEEAAQLGFMVTAKTEHVLCHGGAHLDYYRTHGGDLLAAQGDMIYRLRKPKGDPRDFHAGLDGPGFDCAIAANAAEHIVCDDVRLSALDRQIAAGMKRLAAATPESLATVRVAQSAWRASLWQRCDAGGPVPEHADDVAAIRDCLAEIYPDRATLFGGVAVVTAQGYAIEPRMRFATRPKPLFIDSDCFPWLTGGTAAAAFNAYVAETLKRDAERIDPDRIRLPANFPADMALTARRSYRVVRFDGRLISIEIETDDFTGGTHDHPHAFAINWDLKEGAPLNFAALFAWNKDGLHFATDVAVKDLARQFGDEPPPQRDDVAAIVADPSAWLFGPSAATIHFNVYAIADFSKGAFDVAIPYAALKEYLRADAAPLAGVN